MKSLICGIQNIALAICLRNAIRNKPLSRFQFIYAFAIFFIHHSILNTIIGRPPIRIRKASIYAVNRERNLTLQLINIFNGLAGACSYDETPLSLMSILVELHRLIFLVRRTQTQFSEERLNPEPDFILDYTAQPSCCPTQKNNRLKQHVKERTAKYLFT